MLTTFIRSCSANFIDNLTICSYYVPIMSLQFRLLFLISALTPTNSIAGLMLHSAGLIEASLFMGFISVLGVVATISIAHVFISQHTGNTFDITDLDENPEDILSYIILFVPVFISSSFDSWQSILSLIIFYVTIVMLIYKERNLIPNPLLSLFGWRYFIATIKEGTNQRKRLVVVKPNDRIDVGKNYLIRLSNWGVYLYDEDSSG